MVSSVQLGNASIYLFSEMESSLIFELIFRAIVMYNILPETEGRTLEDIEMHYSDDTKSITVIHIDRNAKPKNQHSY